MGDEKPENPLIRSLAVPFLISVGVLFLLAAFFETFRSWIEQWIGAVNFIYLGVGFLFFYTAVLVAEKNLFRRKFLGLLDEIKGFFLGPDHHRISEAIEILLNAIGQGDEETAKTAAKEMTKITGQDFGTDHERWLAWWSENRIRFFVSRQKASDSKAVTFNKTGGDSDDRSP
ncbi:MAG: hypothetical protein KJ645_11835 [Planctomycetes bacterium]|nr:hypothetical protein [Planctomycetota bacterium]